MTYFTQQENLWVHPVGADGCIPFLSVAESYSIVYAQRIVFLHSSVGGHLGCFHVLAVVNGPAGVRGSFQSVFFSACLPGVRWLDHTVGVF